MALTPAQIEAAIADLGQDLPQTMGAVIQAAADQAIEDMKNRMNFDHNSSDGVRATIISTLDESTMTLGISMPAHGYFQNFGVESVDGKGKNTEQLEIDELTAEAFGSSANTTMKFGTQNYGPGPGWGAYYSGLNAKNFLQLELFVDQVADYVNQNLEL